MKKVDKLIYYDNQMEHEIPLHIQRISLIADFKDAFKVEIKSVCHNREECALWEKLIEILSPYRKKADLEEEEESNVE